MATTPDILLVTSLSVAECVDRLDRAARRPALMDAFLPPPQGTVTSTRSGERFRLYAHGRRGVHNSWAPFFYGRFEACDQGTRICGRFRAHPSVRVFMTLWFTGIVLLGGLTVLVCLARLVAPEGHKDLSQLLGVVVPPALFAFGCGMVRIGWWMGRGQRGYLMEFLQRTLDAEPATHDGATSA